MLADKVDFPPSRVLILAFHSHCGVALAGAVFHKRT